MIVRAVIVDFGGVLGRPPSAEALARLQLISGFENGDGFLGSWRQHRLAYDLGEVSAAEFWRRVGSARERDYAPAILARLRAADAACWATQDASLAAWLGGRDLHWRAAPRPA